MSTAVTQFGEIQGSKNKRTVSGSEKRDLRASEHVQTDHTMQSVCRQVSAGKLVRARHLSLLIAYVEKEADVFQASCAELW